MIKKERNYLACSSGSSNCQQLSFLYLEVDVFQDRSAKKGEVTEEQVAITIGNLSVIV
jgi:hypothetical protein